MIGKPNKLRVFVNMKNKGNTQDTLKSFVIYAWSTLKYKKLDKQIIQKPWYNYF